MPFYQPGDLVLDDYEIEAFIGEGGFGEVYRALDRDLKEDVALKILRRADAIGEAYYERARQRFTLEARLGRRITHPHVIRIHRFAPDKSSGLLVLVMEYIPGGSLADRLRSGPLAVGEALRLARQVAAGLGALHGQDVVHRDLKPSNILLDAAGLVRVADLGLAQAANTLQLTDPSSGGGGQTWHSPGTPAYMSPEQARDQRHLQPASDIYALGLILFEMLTGRSYKNQPPETRLSALRRDVPAALDELVAGMLSEEPSQRPWDGAAAEKALQELSSTEPAASAVDPIQSRTPATLTLEDGLSALKDMEEAQDWQLALETLEQLEAAFPGHIRLKLPHKRITQVLDDQARAKREAEEKAKREAEAQARHEAEEKAKREAERRPGYLRRAGDRIFIRLDSAQEMAFVRIPAGEFLVGSDPKKDQQAYSDEQPQHRVSLPEYWMGLTPVTNAQYAAYIMAVKGEAPAHWKNNQPPQDRLDHPVVHVGWRDAVAYCEWLSELTGRQVGLPTEAEWEKAARGTDGRIYPWGDQTPDEKRCNFDGQVGGTTPVGRYSPAGDSPYGCVDMAGNVWEWCADWYDGNYYAKSPATSPAGPASGEYRVVRGGSWSYDTRFVRAAIRCGDAPDYRSYSLGFRCRLSLL